MNIKSQNYISILEIIKSKKHQARLVGGVVRDAIIGIESQDVDIVTSMLPEEVTKVFNSLGQKVIPTGIKFGTASVLYNGELFEVTTLRKDISSDGRHAEVEYTDDFYLDALRRDFTINALSYCPFEEKIYDYFDGIKLPNYSDIIILMDDSSILQEILPISNLRLAKFIDAVIIAFKLDISLTNETKYALLFVLGGIISYTQLIDLKFSRIEARAISNLLSMIQQQDIDEWFLKKYG